MIGEIGGTAEEECGGIHQGSGHQAGDLVHRRPDGPSGPEMGHAGAIISGGRGTAEEKFKALEQAGVAVEKNPAEIGRRVQEILKARK